MIVNKRILKSSSVKHLSDWKERPTLRNERMRFKNWEKERNDYLIIIIISKESNKLAQQAVQWLKSTRRLIYLFHDSRTLIKWRYGYNKWKVGTSTKYLITVVYMSFAILSTYLSPKIRRNFFSEKNGN